MKISPLKLAFLLPFLLALAWQSASGQRTEVVMENKTGLPADSYSVYAVGYSAASKKMLAANGRWVPVPRASGKIYGHKIGPRGFSTVLERSNPVDGGIVLLVVAPKNHGDPYVTYTDGGVKVVQPGNPPSNQWPGTQGRLIYQFIELTQPATKNPTIDISMVNGFVLPIHAVARNHKGGLVAQVGQPLNKVVNRARVMSIYWAFLKKEDIPWRQKEAYRELLAKSGKTLGKPSAILNPGLFLAAGANSGSLLNRIWNPVLKELFQTPGRHVGMRGDDGGYYKGSPTKNGGLWYLDFVGYSDAECTKPNGNRYRVYSPLTRDPLGSYQTNESPGCMVFANDGVFADSSANAVASGPSSVALGLQRDIVSALNRGVALLGGTSGKRGENSYYWGLENKWYPKGQIYNVFSRFMHTARIGNQYISMLPNGALGRPARDAQGALMGMSYGFGYDESPVHSKPTAPPLGPGRQPNVPSNFDPTSANTAKVVVTLGAWN